MNLTVAPKTLYLALAGLGGLALFLFLGENEEPKTEAKEPREKTHRQHVTNVYVGSESKPRRKNTIAIPKDAIDETVINAGSGGSSGVADSGEASESDSEPEPRLSDTVN